MRTIVIYKQKRKKPRWVYMSFPTEEMKSQFIARAAKVGITVEVKTIRC